MAEFVTVQRGRPDQREKQKRYDGNPGELEGEKPDAFYTFFEDTLLTICCVMVLKVHYKSC